MIWKIRQSEVSDTIKGGFLSPHSFHQMFITPSQIVIPHYYYINDYDSYLIEKGHSSRDNRFQCRVHHTCHHCI